MVPVLLLLAAMAAAAFAQCDITGNWTSSLSPDPSSVVHIEIFQDDEGNIVVHATPWGGLQSCRFAFHARLPARLCLLHFDCQTS
jgi:hypothetical protein